MASSKWRMGEARAWNTDKPKGGMIKEVTRELENEEEGGRWEEEEEKQEEEEEQEEEEKEEERTSKRSYARRQR